MRVGVAGEGRSKAGEARRRERVAGTRSGVKGEEVSRRDGEWSKGGRSE